MASFCPSSSAVHPISTRSVGDLFYMHSRNKGLTPAALAKKYHNGESARIATVQAAPASMCNACSMHESEDRYAHCVAAGVRASLDRAE